MGREHRLSRDPRLRQARDRRTPRIQAALRVERIALHGGRAIAGIDVGEDFLDLAILPPARDALEYCRVPLEGLRAPAVARLAERIARIAPALGAGAIALVDSPRAPVDMDCSSALLTPRSGIIEGREIDRAVREFVRRPAGAESGRLAMFPTPRLSYFARCVRASECKPHLRAIARELFGSHLSRISRGLAPPRGGGVFTRFMLAGFATYPALEMIGAVPYESYPYLQFRLWSANGTLASKRRPATALTARHKICARIARAIGLRTLARPESLDEADAAILALSAAAAARHDRLVALVFAPEGRFAIALKRGRPWKPRKSGRA